MGPPADVVTQEDIAKSNNEDEALPLQRTPSNSSQSKPIQVSPAGLLNKPLGISTRTGAGGSSVPSKPRLPPIPEKGVPGKASTDAPKGRNLVNTNVIKLYSAVVKSSEVEQLCYYNSGIGTYAEPSLFSLAYLKQFVENKIDLAIAWNFEKIIYGAYRWLSDNWQEHDQIYLFGFSRGAYQVRALAGMIHKVGLLYPGNAEQIPFAYELYSKEKEKVIIEKTLKASKSDDATLASAAKSAQTTTNLAMNFKRTFSRQNVRVRFIGAWDTVSSIGIIRWKSLPLTDTADHVTYFRHALALDERRVKFLPEYVNGGACEGGIGRRSPEDGGLEHVKEVWFPGTHSDIGGGNFDNLTQETAPYLWMATEAASCGLALELPEKTDWEEQSETQESLSKGWYILEYIPFPILTYEDSTTMHFRPHQGKGRKILPKQKLHPSIAYQPNYTPRADLKSAWKDLTWSQLAGQALVESTDWKSLWHGRLEDDLSNLRELLEKLRTCDVQDEPRWKFRLSGLTLSVTACGIILENIADIVLLFETKAQIPGSDLGAYAISLIDKLCHIQADTPRIRGVRTWLLSAARNLGGLEQKAQAVRCLACSLSRERKIVVKAEETKFGESFDKLIKETNLVVKKDTKGANSANSQASLRSVLDRIKDEIGDADAATKSRTATAEAASTDTLLATSPEVAPHADHQQDQPLSTVNRQRSWLSYAQAGLLSSIQAYRHGLSVWAKSCYLSRRLLDEKTLNSILTIQLTNSGEAERANLMFCCSVIENGVLDKRIHEQILDYLSPALHAYLPPLCQDDFEIQRRAMAFLTATTKEDAIQKQMWSSELLNVLPDMLSSRELEVRSATLDAISAAMENRIFKEADFTVSMITPIRESLWSPNERVRRSAIQLFSQAINNVEDYIGLWKGSTLTQIREAISSGDSTRKQMALECLTSAVSNAQALDSESTSTLEQPLLSTSFNLKDLVCMCLNDSSEPVRICALKFYMAAVKSELWRHFWDANAISGMHGTLSSAWSWMIQQQAVECLTAALENDKLYNEVLKKQVKVIQTLRDWLWAEGDEDVRKSIVRFFGAACQLDDKLRKDLCKADVVMRFKEDLSNNYWWTRDQAINRLSVVMGDSRLHPVLFDHTDLIECLYQTIWDSDPDVRQSTRSLFSETPPSDELRLFWTKERVLQTKTQLLESNDPITMLSLLLPLILSSNSNPDQTWFPEANAQLVLDNLMDPMWYRRDRALQVLRAVTKNEILAPLLWKPTIALHIEKLLDDSDVDVRRSAFSCLKTAVLQKEHVQVFVTTEYLAKLALRHITCQLCRNGRDIVDMLTTLVEQDRLSQGFIGDHGLPLLRQILRDENSNARVNALAFLTSVLNHHRGQELPTPELVKDIRGIVQKAREPELLDAFWSLVRALAGLDDMKLCEELLPTQDIVSILIPSVNTIKEHDPIQFVRGLEQLLSIDHDLFQERLIASLASYTIQERLVNHRPIIPELNKLVKDIRDSLDKGDTDIYIRTIGGELIQVYDNSTNNDDGTSKPNHHNSGLSVLHLPFRPDWRVFCTVTLLVILVTIILVVAHIRMLIRQMLPVPASVG